MPEIIYHSGLASMIDKEKKYPQGIDPRGYLCVCVK